MGILDRILNYIKLSRIKHYLKNFLVFLPLIFSGNLLVKSYFVKCIIGVLIFSFTSSIVYILNDIRDKDKDRNHPKKKQRPIASGKVSLKEAILLILFFILFVVFLVCKISLNLSGILLLVVYLLINICYSFGLKNIALVDLIILVFGFVIRVLFGGNLIDVEVSNWLILTILSIAFYLALGKRRNELINVKKDTRKVLKYYTKEFLDKNMYMCLSLGIVFYSLWTVDSKIVANVGNNLIWTVPFVIIICMRYNMLVEGDSDGDPVEVVTHDIMMMCLILIYSILLVGILYL